MRDGSGFRISGQHPAPGRLFQTGLLFKLLRSGLSVKSVCVVQDQGLGMGLEIRVDFGEDAFRGSRDFGVGAGEGAGAGVRNRVQDSIREEGEPTFRTLNATT